MGIRFNVKEPLFILSVLIITTFTVDYLLYGRVFGLACGYTFSFLIISLLVYKSTMEEKKDKRIQKMEDEIRSIKRSSSFSNT